MVPNRNTNEKTIPSPTLVSRDTASLLPTESNGSPGHRLLGEQQPGGTQLGAAGPGVPPDLFVRRHSRLSHQQVPNATLAERMLDQTVLQRVEADHHGSACYFQARGQRRKCLIEAGQFMGYGGSQRP